MFTLIELLAQTILKLKLFDNVLSDSLLRVAVVALIVLLVIMALGWLFRFLCKHSAVIIPVLMTYAGILTWVHFFAVVFAFTMLVNGEVVVCEQFKAELICV